MSAGSPAVCRDRARRERAHHHRGPLRPQPPATGAPRERSRRRRATAPARRPSRRSPRQGRRPARCTRRRSRRWTRRPSHREAVADLDPLGARQRAEVGHVRRVVELGVVGRSGSAACTSSHSASSGAASWSMSGSISAPACTSRCAIRTWSVPPPAIGPGEWNEPCAVQPSGVPPMPGSATAVASAPRASSAATTSPCPHQAPWCSGVPPICPGRPTGTPSSSRSSTPRAAPPPPPGGAPRRTRCGALHALRVRGRQAQRAVAVAGEAEPDQLVDRADLAARAELGEHLAVSGRPIRHASPYGVRSFCSSHACTSAPAATSMRITSGERPR